MPVGTYSHVSQTLQSCQSELTVISVRTYSYVSQNLQSDQSELTVRSVRTYSHVSQNLQSDHLQSCQSELTVTSYACAFSRLQHLLQAMQPVACRYEIIKTSQSCRTHSQQCQRYKLLQVNRYPVGEINHTLHSCSTYYQ